MPEDRVTLGHEPAEVSLEVPLHLGVGVLLDQERSGGVTDVESEQPGTDPRLTYPLEDVVGELDETLSPGPHLELVNFLTDGALRCPGFGLR